MVLMKIHLSLMITMRWFNIITFLHDLNDDKNVGLLLYESIELNGGSLLDLSDIGRYVSAYVIGSVGRVVFGCIVSG